MTSDRQKRANRANAKSSTGPKTAAGKARAAQNAFRHGLNVPVLSDPLLAPEIEAMAHRISGPYADAETAERARWIAEAHFDLNRVRSSRRLLMLVCFKTILRSRRAAAAARGGVLLAIVGFFMTTESQRSSGIRAGSASGANKIEEQIWAYHT